MVPLRSWLSKVSHMATSGTLVTPSVMMMIPESQTGAPRDKHTCNSLQVKVNIPELEFGGSSWRARMP